MATSFESSSLESTDAPSVDGCERLGDELARSGQPEAATDEYKRALFLLGSERSSRRAGLYVKLGDIARGLGKPRVAVNNYVKALGIEPKSSAAYDALVELSLSERDFAALDELQWQRSVQLESLSEKIAALRDNAGLWLEHARDPGKALRPLERWLELCAGDAEALRLLVSAYTWLGRHEDAVESLSRLGDALAGAEAVAAFRDAAQVALDKLSDRVRAVGLLERALAVDVDQREVLAQAEQLLSEQQDFPRLALLYERVAEGTTKKKRKLRAWQKLAALSRDRLRDPARAARALTAAVAIDQSDAALLRELSEVELELGSLDDALEHTRRAVALSPREASGYHQAYEIFERMGIADGAFNAAAILDHLGEADINESVLADAHRPEGLLSPQAVLGDEEWEAGSLIPERDSRIHRVLMLVGPAAIEHRIESLRRSKQLPTLDESERQDIQASTATLVRALAWSTRVLGVEPPELYLRGEVSGEIQAVPGPGHALVACRSLGSGLDLKELAFLWGRALFALRPEHRVSVYFGTPDELVTLLGAARAAAGRAPKPSGEAKALVASLEKALSPEQRAALKELTADVDDFRPLAEEWLLRMELGAVRAGLLVCGDVAAAALLTERFPFGRLRSPVEQVDSMLAFSLSDAYLGLRRRLGFAISS